jgi:hypothetical protein
MSKMQELAKRAVACKHWRWMPGMLAKTVWAEARVLGGKEERPVLAAIHHHGNGLMLHHPNNLPCDSFPQANTAYPFLPDLTDPATLGCLLALVRRVRPYACVEYCGGYWRVVDPEDEHWDTDRGFGPWCSEAEALVAALEAAP